MLCSASAPPLFCPEGFFCGDGGASKTLCPKGSWCPTGNLGPIPCKPGSRCPAGSARETPVLPVLVTVLAVVLLLVLAWIMDRTARKRRAKVFDAGEAGGSGPGQHQPTPTPTPATATTAHGSSTAPLGLSFSSLGWNGILSECSGSFRGGRLTVVMGPSGAGKSTLLGLVTGLEDPSEGSFTLGDAAGIASMRPYRALVGLVPQSDNTMLSAMTVEEVLNHAVDTRLVAGSKERRRAVNETLMELGIAHVRACVIGDADDRGLSGGEKKRVSIGVELVARPRVLFLDEPTSGLDAATALSLMRTLSSLAKDQNITVVAVLHQPRFEIFELADDLLLLRAGRVVYSGERARVMGYLPHQPALHENPADFLMDNLASMRPSGTVTATAAGITTPTPTPAAAAAAIPLPARPNFFTLTLLYLKRALLQQMHGLRGVALSVFLQMLVGVSMGIAMRKKQRVLPPLPMELQGACPDVIRDACLNRAPNSEALVIWVFFMTLSANGVYSLTGTNTFGLEAVQWRRERRSGASLLAYHLGKFLSVLPSLSVETFATCACFHLLASPRAAFGDNYAALWCLGFSAYAVGHLVSVVVNDQRSHLITSIAIGVAVSIFTGSFPSLIKVNRYWIATAVWSLAYTRWSAEALVVAEVRPAGQRSAEVINDTYGFVATPGQFKTDLGVCIALGIILRIIMVLIAARKK
jgi:ABC-type multidrug transport system ATPase subunit